MSLLTTSTRVLSDVTLETLVYTGMSVSQVGSPSFSGHSVWRRPEQTPEALAAASEAAADANKGIFDTSLARRVIVDEAGNVAFGDQVDIPGDTVRAIFVAGPSGVRKGHRRTNSAAE